MEKSLVSVIIPSHGGGQYLARAIDSVLSQTYPNIEIIVVDDNGLGTPNQLSTQQIMQKYCSNEKVKCVCHELNKNGSAARNTGFKYSSGKYIALLDDDDEYLPPKIERQVADIERLDDSYALVYCSNEVILDGKISILKKTRSGNLFYEVMTHEVTIGTDSLLIRRNVWEELNGFDESFKRHQDYEFTARVAHKYKVYAEDFIGFRYIVLKRNSPKDIDTALQYRKHFIDKMMPYIKTLPERQQKDIIVSNLMCVCVQYLHKGQIWKFFKKYRSLHLGIYGMKYILNKIRSKIFKKMIKSR